MSILVGILLGIIQGITEFLPVSSTGHLVIVGEVIDLGNTFVFDVLLNIGTLAALIWYSKRRIMSISRQLLKGDYKLAAKVVAATVPAALAGVVFSSQIESYNENLGIAIVMLALIGLIMIFAKEKKPAKTKLADISWRVAVLIGFAQALALIPGTSRSGITILAALYLGLNKKLAAEWSFLLAIPIIFGATMKVLVSQEGITFISNNFIPVFLGNVASFIVGMLSIGVLLKVISSKNLRPFGYYRVGLAAILVFLVSISAI